MQQLYSETYRLPRSSREVILVYLYRHISEEQRTTPAFEEYDIGGCT